MNHRLFLLILISLSLIVACKNTIQIDQRAPFSMLEASSPPIVEAKDVSIKVRLSVTQSQDIRLTPSVRISPSINISVTPVINLKLPEANLYDVTQDSFETYALEPWPENATESLYGFLPYHVLFDGISNADGVRVSTVQKNAVLVLKPDTALSPSHTHASLVTTSLKDAVPSSFFWFEVDMTTKAQLRSEPNAWERGWLVWNLSLVDPELPEELKNVVPYSFYYFYVKEASENLFPLEIGKIEPNNPEAYDCAFNVKQYANFDCDNDGETDDVLFGTQRFFPFRFDENEQESETGDCFVHSVLPEEGFMVGETNRFRILHHQDSFEIYWIIRDSSNRQVAQKLVSCQDKLNPYTKGAIGFYTEDAEVQFDNFRLQAFELGRLSQTELASSASPVSKDAASVKQEQNKATPVYPYRLSRHY